MGELKPLMIPDELREKLAAEAAGEGISLEAMAVQAVERHLEAIKTRKFFDERKRNADPEWLMQFLNREGGEPPGAGDELPVGYARTR
jgi:hypothetical protein